MNIESKKIKEPVIKKYPTEIFGYSFINKSEEAQEALEKQLCPYIKKECNKPRKSEPEVKVGICSVGYKGVFSNTFRPVIICPNRICVDRAFKIIEEQYLSDWAGNIVIEWVPEVSLGVGGSVDYIAVKKNKKNSRIEDFLCIEFQSTGTTGTPWQAILDLKKTGSFLKDTYPYGINWAMEFSKTMMQQVLKKGKIIEEWGRKIVYVLQDVGLEYLRSSCDTSCLRSANDSDPIHFCTLKLVWDEKSSWELAFNEKISTNVSGIKEIIGGATKENYPTVEEFIKNIAKKSEKNKNSKQLSLLY